MRKLEELQFSTFGEYAQPAHAERAAGLAAAGVDAVSVAVYSLATRFVYHIKIFAFWDIGLFLRSRVRWTN